MSGIEQRRRDFMREQPELYQYILDLQTARVLDQAGDAASGSSHRLANWFWRQAGEATARMAQARLAGTDPEPPTEQLTWAEPETP